MNVIPAMVETLALARAEDMPPAGPLSLAHLTEMLKRAQAGNFSYGKQCRWLAWMQAAVTAGYLEAEQDTVLNMMKEINKRHAEDPDPSSPSFQAECAPKVGETILDRHHRIVPSLVRAIAHSTVQSGGNFADILVLLESVVFGTFQYSLHIGATNGCLDELIRSVKKRNAEAEMLTGEPAGRG